MRESLHARELQSTQRMLKGSPREPHGVMAVRWDGGSRCACLCKLGQLRRHRCGEEERLALLRQAAPDVPDLLGEAHLEEAVRLVEHGHLHRLERHPFHLGQVVQQAPGRRDENVRVRSEFRELGLEGVASDEEADPQVREFGEVAGEFVRLIKVERGLRADSGNGAVLNGLGGRAGAHSRAEERIVEGRDGIV